MSFLRNKAPLIVTLESGLVVRLRPIHEGDTARIRQAYGLLSEESRMNRFWEKPTEINASRADALADTGTKITLPGSPFTKQMIVSRAMPELRCGEIPAILKGRRSPSLSRMNGNAKGSPRCSSRFSGSRDASRGFASTTERRAAVISRSSIGGRASAGTSAPSAVITSSPFRWSLRTRFFKRSLLKCLPLRKGSFLLIGWPRGMICHRYNNSIL